jgi:hypothetical protein
MRFFSSRHRPRPSATLAAIPGGGGSAARPARLGDPIAQAARGSERRDGEAISLGGIAFRSDRQPDR